MNEITDRKTIGEFFTFEHEGQPRIGYLWKTKEPLPLNPQILCWYLLVTLDSFLDLIPENKQSEFESKVIELFNSQLENRHDNLETMKISQ